MRTVEVRLPRLHAAQEAVLSERRRFNALACGRRWGKNYLGEDVAVNAALDGKRWAWGAPNYKYLDEAWGRITRTLAPVTKHKNASERIIELVTGGRIDFWTLADQNVGRGYAYDGWTVDEAAMVPRLWSIWNEAIRPTLTDRHGEAWFLSTPKGRDAFWQLYSYGQDPEMAEWNSWQMPTAMNPTLPGLAEEIEAARTGGMPERSFRQEYLAEFIEDGGGVFRGVRACIDQGRRENGHNGSGWFQAGLDVARHEDFTVLTVFDDKGVQVWWERINQVSWERVIASTKAVCERFDCRVVVDSTGVGDAIFDRLQTEGLNVKGVNFTPAVKEALVDNLAILIEHGQVRLMDHDVQTNELLAFRYEMTPSRHLRMSAPEGMHDDCVIGLCLAADGFIRGFGSTVVERVRTNLPPEPVPLEEGLAQHELNRRILEAEEERRGEEGGLRRVT